MATKEQWQKAKDRRLRGVQYCPACQQEKSISEFSKCNSAIGLFKEDINILRNAIQYLQTTDPLV